MKVTQLRLAGHGAWLPLALDHINPELNVLTGPRGAGKSTIARLASHLLYGKIEGPAAPNTGAATPLAEGSLEVDGPQGTYLLRRHRDGTAQGRLSIASAGGAAVDSGTIRALLAGLSPRLLAELYSVDFNRTPRPAALLEGEFAREFALAAGQCVEPVTPGVVCEQHAGSPNAAPVNRRDVEELVRRRDQTVRQIEEQMSGRRRNSEALQRELGELDVAIATRRKRSEELAARIRAVEGKLAEIDARLRYYTLATAVRKVPAGQSEQLRLQLEQLDAEIARCRQTLSDLQSRESTVRRELAEVHPDGRSDSASSLADERATLGVLERLLNDLDAEVSQLARAHEPGRCVGCDAHARLSPVAQMLRQQLYALCGQVTEQERTVRRVQLAAESRQLSRAQTDLSERLEHLLERRQSLVHQSQLNQQPVVLLPQTPAAEHCQCEHHDDFVRRADAVARGGADRNGQEDDVRQRRLDLEQQQRDLRTASDSLARETESLLARQHRLQLDLAQAAGRSTLDELRAELERLETEISRALARPAAGHAPDPLSPAHRHIWKASDALAQLTNGELAQIRHSPQGRTAIVDRSGRTLELETLTPAQQDQLYLSLTLALVSSFASRGVDLPLVLDEPFLRQDTAAAAAMAGVLYEFARQGRQMIVLTANREAVGRFESLGADVRDVDLVRRQNASGGEQAPAPLVTLTPEPPRAAAASTTVRLVRETVGEAAPQLRLAGEWTHGENEPQTYYLTTDTSLADFPMLGNDTAKVFAGLGIHTVEDLLVAAAPDVARRLKRPTITADAVRLWQTHMSLMCYVPSLSLNDAQVLAACDVSTPEALHTIDVRLLAESIGRFLATQRGRRFATAGKRLSRERLADLQKLARRQRDRWRQASERYTLGDRPLEPIAKLKPRRTARTRTPGVALPVKKVRRSRRQPLRFMLQRNSLVAEAPSVSSVAAERLAKVGVRTVADLLNVNPESTAEEIGEPTLTASLIARWQSQARLSCRIPELRGLGSRLLVACGFTEPEQVAGANADEVFAKVRAFCRGPQGRRVLGRRKAPSRQRVAAWIRHAAQMRPMEAA